MPGDVTSDRLLAAVGWDWVEVESLMAQLIPTVAPGKALRMYQNRAAHNKGTGNRPQFTEDEQIESGARQIVNDRIGAQVDSGRLELQRDEEGKRRVRQRVRTEVADARGCCPSCNRPFPPATVEQAPPPPSQKQRHLGIVLRPGFPQWDRSLPEGSSG